MPSLNPTGYNALKLIGMRDKLKKQFQRAVTWNEVLGYFFKTLKDQATQIHDLTDQVRELGGKVEAKVATIEEIALNLSQRAPSPMMMQANPSFINQPQTMINQHHLTPPKSPPTLPPSSLPRHILSAKAPSIIKEMEKQFIDGKILPSLIQTATFDEPKLLELTE